MMRESTSTGPTNLKTISREELKRHAHQGDLWMAVDGMVANLTDFITSHPGGVDLLLQHAGMEIAPFGRPFHLRFTRMLMDFHGFSQVSGAKRACAMIRNRLLGQLKADAGRHGGWRAFS